jgi:hypothetical protein
LLLPIVSWEILGRPQAGTWFVSLSPCSPLHPFYTVSIQHPKLTVHKQPEFAHPYEILSSQCEVIVASPNGGEAPLDPSSVEAFKEDPVSSKFLKHSESLWKNTHKLSEFSGKANDFEAIFFVGGHGRMCSPFPNLWHFYKTNICGERDNGATS